MEKKKKTDVPNPYQGLNREQVLDQARQLAAEETRNQVLIGLLYNYLVDSKLLNGTQYKTAVDFICGNVQQLSKAAVIIYGAVARKFAQEVCARYGVYRLKALLAYAEAKKLELDTTEPGSTFILVPDENGEVKPKLFSACTVEEVRSAVQHVRTEASNKPIPDAERELVDQYREAVVGHFPQGSPVRVQLRVHKSEPVVHFQYIPVGQVATLTEALLDSLYPAKDEPEGGSQAA